MNEPLKRADIESAMACSWTGENYDYAQVAKQLNFVVVSLLARCANEARLEALEQAARVCNDVAQQETIRTQGHPTSGAYEVGSRNCAAAIRALKAAPAVAMTESTPQQLRKAAPEPKG